MMSLVMVTAGDLREIFPLFLCGHPFYLNCPNFAIHYVDRQVEKREKEKKKRKKNNLFSNSLQIINTMSLVSCSHNCYFSFLSAERKTGIRQWVYQRHVRGARVLPAGALIAPLRAFVGHLPSELSMGA